MCKALTGFKFCLFYYAYLFNYEMEKLSTNAVIVKLNT